jgi:hypothetical protein
MENEYNKERKNIKKTPSFNRASQKFNKETLPNIIIHKAERKQWLEPAFLGVPACRWRWGTGPKNIDKRGIRTPASFLSRMRHS